MALNQTCERLFLLEIFVENLKILSSLLDKPSTTDGTIPEKEFCLAVKLGSLPCFELCRSAENGEEEEDEENGNTLLTFVWKEGKNCLFPMTPCDLEKLIKEFPLILVLRQSTLEDSISSTIGKTEILLEEDMVQMVREAERWLPDDPVTEVLQDRFNLTGPENNFVGTIQLMVRLTCLGAAVFTSFEVTADRKFRFNKDKSRFDQKCKACATGKVVSCDDLKEKAAENTESIQQHSQEYEDKASPSVVVMAQRNHSQLACSCSQKNILTRRRNQRNCLKTLTPVAEQNSEPRRTKRFFPGPLNRRHHVTLGHGDCKAVDLPVPARHGWAWTTAAPYGLKFSEIQGWQPGFYRKCYLRSMKNKPDVKLVRQSKVKEEKGTRRRRKIDVIPTVQLIRGNGHCHITYAPSGSKRPEHFDHSVASDDSDLELTVVMPKPMPRPPNLRHQAQQFCEEDFITKIKTKNVKGKKKPKSPVKGKKVPKTKKPKPEKIVVRPKPWDDWILKINCHTNMKNWRPMKSRISKKSKNERKQKRHN